MKLLGKDISTTRVLEHIEARLKARGLSDQVASPIDLSGVEPRVDPSAFYLEAMAEHADATRPLPLETHRTGLGRAVLLAKWSFRKGAQVFINEALGRQRLFNGHVRDAYAQLTAEVNALRAEVEAMRQVGGRRSEVGGTGQGAEEKPGKRPKPESRAPVKKAARKKR